MKKKDHPILRLLIVLSFIACIHFSKSQTSVNREWITGYGGPVFNPLLAPYGGDWTKSIVAANSDIITVGHTAISGQGENVLITRHASNGTPIWQADYNLASTKNDYGIDVIEDPNTGNLYVCGTSDNGGSTNYDILILIYDGSGNLLFDTRYDGPDSKNDVPGAIKIDSNGNLVIAGTSEYNSSLCDYLMLNYDTSLNLNWYNTYDYTNLNDVSVALEISGGKVTLAGGSANSLTDVDMTLVDFDESDGSLLGDNRMSYPGFGYDEVTSFRKDAAGNFYVTGKCSSNGTDYDIRIAKVDNTNTLLWSQTYNAFNLTDVGTTIGVDVNGNVIVGGFITKAGNKKDLIILKYDPTGTLLWKHIQSSSDPSSDAAIKAIAIHNSEIYYIAGDKEIGGNRKSLVGRLYSNGIKNWERNIKGNYDHLPSDIQYGGLGTDGVYAITILDSTLNTYKLTLFTEFDQPDTVVTPASGKKFVKHESIIRFDKKTIKTAMVNNLDKQFGILSDFVQDSTITKMDILLNSGESCADWKAWKIFPNLTTNDTMSQTRMGNSIKIPEFYCAIELNLPTNMNTKTTTNLLASMQPDIHYSEVNYIGDPCGADDPYFGVQANLRPNAAYPNAHINVDSAWVISNGESHVKVGVFDSGIYKWHEEFDTIKGMYFPTMSPLDGNDGVGHGTSLAGVIGAKRNNNKGVAGIAGGNDSISKKGVSLYDCRVAPSGSYKYSVLINALQYSSMSNTASTTNPGLGIHVANNSFVWAHTGTNGFQWTLTQDSFQMYAEQINFANRNGVAYIGAKGNNNIASYAFPADFSDEIQMSIGASGNNGNWCMSGINCSHGSYCGGNIDFVAPGSTVVVSTTTAGSISGYGNRGGTSHAAAHVSGVVGLMMSYYNKPIPHWDNLVHEDCENLLRIWVDDLNTTTTYYQHNGRDSVTGWGRINAYKTLKNMNKNYWKVFHIDQSHYVTSSSTSTNNLYTNQSIAWPAIGNQPSGTYNTNIVELTTTLNYSFPSNYAIHSYWPLYKECRGWQDTLFVKKTRPFFTKIVSVTGSQAVLKTYYFVKTSNGQTYPEPSANLHRSAISLLVRDPNGVIGINENLTNQKNFVTFPNPSKESFNVAFSSDFPSSLNYKVYDLLGKEVLTGTYETQLGKNVFSLDMLNKAHGLYILNVFDNSKLVYTQKLIKN